MNLPEGVKIIGVKDISLLSDEYHGATVFGFEVPRRMKAVQYCRVRDSECGFMANWFKENIREIPFQMMISTSGAKNIYTYANVVLFDDEILLFNLTFSEHFSDT